MPPFWNLSGAFIRGGHLIEKGVYRIFLRLYWTPCKFLSIIMLDSVIMVNKKYSQTFLEECKYVQEKIKNENYIDDDLKSDSNSNEECDE